MLIDAIDPLSMTCTDEQLFAHVEKALTELYYGGVSAGQLVELVSDFSSQIKARPDSLCA